LNHVSSKDINPLLAHGEAANNPDLILLFGSIADIAGLAAESLMSAIDGSSSEAGK
jgi:hypothetical protein